jgi:ATP phosphoribosyltransferase regulatory subunit HisZ
VALHVDLADLTGYHYRTAAIFSVFTAGQTRALGNGGRYDGIARRSVARAGHRIHARPASPRRGHRRESRA